MRWKTFAALAMASATLTSCQHARTVCTAPRVARSPEPSRESEASHGREGEASHVGTAVCMTSAARPGCTPNPKGKTSGQGNTSEYVVCIPSKPQNSDATCQPFQAALEDKAGNAALGICVGVHQVQCQKVSCSDTCVNTATMTDSQGMYLKKNAPECKAGEDGCELGNTGWDCTCDCQVQL